MRRFSVERSNKRCKRAWSHLIKSSDGGGRDDEDVEYEKSWPSREYALNLAGNGPRNSSKRDPFRDTNHPRFVHIYISF